MNYRPSAAELLDAIGELLEDEVLPVAPPEIQHKVRVAANLTRILQRESLLEADSLDRERGMLVDLLGHEASVDALRQELSDRLLVGGDRDVNDAGLDQRVWDLLVAVARADLAIVKPGHDSWEGA